jgi:putative RNA 2'-phosphotransferase
VLYHGTATRFLTSIMDIGLQPQARHYVHLSHDKVTALKVGQRHGKAVILEIAASQMQQQGHKFYLSDNQVWLTASVPANYLTVLS